MLLEENSKDLHSLPIINAKLKGKWLTQRYFSQFLITSYLADHQTNTCRSNQKHHPWIFLRRRL